MQLSYILRLICFVVCGAGGLQLALEWAAWFRASVLLRELSSQAGNAGTGSARRAEQALFRLTLAARLGPWLLALGLLLPAYLRGEDNFAGERVGFVSLTLAAGLLLWWSFAFVRLSLAVYRGYRFCRLCPQVGCGPGNVPVLLYPGERCVMAVAGLFSARILVSRPLLDGSRFPAEALQVALAHEAAHARRRDNLKALLLALPPHVPLSTKRRPSLARIWRLAAELAADEEGTQGEPARSLLLAEMLVALAQGGNRRLPQGLLALCSESDHLRVRVERLLGGLDGTTSGKKAEAPAWAGFCLVLAVAACGSMLLALCYGCTVLGHRAAELLFRVG